ncbi:peptidase M13 [Acaricomes phytoseiuli]|uniref:M13 family metallopeptidase n=1 Tax=Acaricomes phytoseiuli TaxID=291968 RepID=UPI0022234D28|nr:M13-type metalloendopeptidase [Acaricomes phytoseiuli]MCW1249181.1 peptidase M13 [Acaricomes phytoseiuli]
MTASGIDSSHFNPGVRPQDDLFQHVNGRWLEESVIPADRASSGAFWELRDNAELAVRQIIERAASAQESAERPDAQTGTLSQAIGDLYHSFMDEAAIEAVGIEPVAADLEELYAVQSVEELIMLSARWQREGVPGLLGSYISNDAGQPDRYLLHLVQAGLGLPDEAYYREPQFAEQRQKYQEYLQRLLELSGHEDPVGAAERVLALEHQLAAAHWDKVTLRDPQKRYNLMTDAAVHELAPRLGPWFAAFLTDPETGQRLSPENLHEMVLLTPDYFARLSELLTEFPLRSWQEWLAARLISAASPYLSVDFVAADFDFHGRALTGTEEIRERWKRGVDLVEDAMGEAIGQLYVVEHFPPEHKARMERLVARLIEAYQRSIQELEWMGEETKARALAKLERFVPKIGYPNRWRDYSGLQISSEDLVGNVRRAAQFETRRQLAKLGRPIDREEWLMTPQTVNAYYHPVLNEIVFPAAILQPPFFDAEADDAANFGGIGAVIGHEIGHGFDDQGSQFDGDGTLRNWWTEADREAFEARTAQLVSQYAELSPAAAPELKVNGELTLGENIGDLGGLSIAYQAWLLDLAEQESPGQDSAESETIDGLSGPQRFFFSWAECWRAKSRHDDAVRRITIDPHSPVEWRCNQVVKNIDAFHEAFTTAPGDGLWLDPEQRVSIW